MVREIIISSFRRCVGCAANTYSPSLVCGRCLEIIKHSRFNPVVIEGGVRALTLGIFENPLIKNLIRALKGGVSRTTNQRLALLMAELLLQSHIRLSENTIIVPAPARGSFHRDHAWFLASALSEVLGLPLQLAIERISDKEQKMLSKYEREHLHFRKVEKISQDRPILFVDDLITTGSTVRAARNTLGKRHPFLAISIGYQPRLVKTL